MSMKTCENIHKELINCITGDDSLIFVSNTFKEFKTDFERVAESYCLLRNYNLLPNFSYKNNRKKSSAASERHRNDGNRAFVQKDDMSAMYHYTRAIGFASPGSKEISIAFANRSAVTYSLGDFTDAIRDIDRALLGDYPDHLKFKLWERRGKAFLELKNFLEAQTSFENAFIWLTKSKLDEDKRNIVKTQLASLLQQSHGDFKTDNVQITALPQLTLGPNPNLQSGSNAIEVEYSSSMGRHIVAKVDISPGDVLAVEKPYSSVPLPSSYFFFCFYCHKRCHSLLPCFHCTLVFFCDEKCRTNCWEESHSIECNILPSLLMLGCDKLELLALRVLIKATEKGSKLNQLATSLSEIESFDKPSRKGFIDNVYFSDSYKSIHNLEGNTDLRNVSYLFGRSLFAACILHILDVNTNFFQKGSVDKVFVQRKLQELEEEGNLRWDKVFAGGLILKYLQSMASNAHEISEMRLIPGNETKTESSEIGSAAYSLLSLINHSCDPNVVRHSYFGSTVVLRAIQVIKRGEQIFDNYGFHHATHSKDERHSHLRSQYLFTCQCIACIENWPLYGNLPDRIPIFLDRVDVSSLQESSKKFRNILYKIISSHDNDKLAEWLVFLYSHLKLLQDSVARPWKEYSECQEAIKQCLSLQANHYVYKACPLTLMELRDDDIGVSPF
ncbi:SET and MYND domain-containing protein 4 [Halyomorpha halys]|uniref:SET and MYND domain-containing protein 4 n=1 Tax=Halyomorpha halys TaxID=286706 RepID=UPI0006D4FF32|nr:SET and MYND domain-containing protein 4-like [Halyomorpha halys]